MSYLVLARKSRPQTFDEVIGQKPVVKTLRNSLSRNRVAHAILFSGVRGVGKTTLARIMAKAINCASTDDNVPCNKCTSCVEITSGSALDLYEIDGASNRGIQEIRELKEKIRFLPTSSKYKIIIIDEVHMLTTEAFNALLKTLEEPPEHVYFIFATTELHKIPITILSRCQQYELKRIEAEELSTHFGRLIEAEGRTIESQALSLIVREAAGSVRDGLSLLDQALSFSDECITTADVVEVLGLIDRDILMDLTQALLTGDRSTAFMSLDQIFKFGMDIKRFCTDLIGQFRTLLLCKIPDCKPLVDLPEDEYQTFLELASQHPTEALHLRMNMLIDMVEGIGRSSQPRLILETTFLKIAEVGNVVPVTSILEKFEQFLEKGEITEAQAIAPTAQDQPQTNEPKKKQLKREPVATERSKEPKTAVETPPIKPDQPTTVPNPPQQIEEHQRPTPPIPRQPKPTPPEPEAAETKKNAQARNIDEDWDSFLTYLHDKATWMEQSLGHVKRRTVEGRTLSLHYDDLINCELLRRKEFTTELEQFLLDFFGKALKVHFILPAAQMDEGNTSSETIQIARNKLQNHPLIIAATEVFRGDVSDVRVNIKK